MNRKQFKANLIILGFRIKETGPKEYLQYLYQDNATLLYELNHSNLDVSSYTVFVNEGYSLQIRFLPDGSMTLVVRSTGKILTKTHSYSHMLEHLTGYIKYDVQ